MLQPNNSTRPIPTYMSGRRGMSMGRRNSMSTSSSNSTSSPNMSGSPLSNGSSCEHQTLDAFIADILCMHPIQHEELIFKCLKQQLIMVDFVGKPHTCHVNVQIYSSEVCGRIVGRRGSVVKKISERTSAKVTSPAVKNNKSDRMFKIEGGEHQIMNTLAAIAGLVFFFRDVMHARLNVKDGEVVGYLPVQSADLSYLLAENGSFIVALRDRLHVNIISPKPYSQDVQFTIIGKPLNVSIAKALINSRKMQL